MINLSEKDYLRQKNKYLPKVMEWLKEHAAGDPVLPISVCFEERLAAFETQAEVDEECRQWEEGGIEENWNRELAQMPFWKRCFERMW